MILLSDSCAIRFVDILSSRTLKWLATTFCIIFARFNLFSFSNCFSKLIHSAMSVMCLPFPIKRLLRSVGAHSLFAISQSSLIQKEILLLPIFASICKRCKREFLLLFPVSHLFNLLDLCKLQFITNGAFIHWSISSESDLATRNGFTLFIWTTFLYREVGVLELMYGGLFKCRSNMFHSTLVVHRPSFIRWQSVILLKSRPVAFSTGDFVISLEIVDKGWIFWSGVKLAGSIRTWIDFISIVLFITEANVIDYYSFSSSFCNYCFSTDCIPLSASYG